MNESAPHVLCRSCGHFRANHSGYPGRHSTSLECTVMSMTPKSIGHDEIVKCKCTVKAQDIHG